MKKLLFGSLLMLGIGMNAQTLTNPGFESWTIGSDYSVDTVPSNWWSMYCNTSHQTTDALAGTYATRLQGYMSCGIAQGILVNGSKPVNYWDDIISSGTPFTVKPATLKGDYKFPDAQPGDSAEVTVILKKYNAMLHKEDTVAFGKKALAPVSVYTAYVVHITDLMPAVMPDSIIIMFNSSKYGMWDPITYALPNLYVDKIGLPEPETVSGITEPENMVESLVYPNPFSDAAVLEIGAHEGGISLEIFDANGAKVLEMNEIKENTVNLTLGNLSAGSYFYLLHDKKGLLGRGKFVVK